MFIKVKIANLKELTNVIPLKVSNEININKDKMNIIIVKKYLLISSRLKLIFVNINLFIKTFLGLLKDKIWFKENLNSEYIFMNLNPELVEKKEPPMITKIKYIKFKFSWPGLREKPILVILLTSAKRFTKKS